jgi:hypothetical protein
MICARDDVEVTKSAAENAAVTVSFQNCRLLIRIKLCRFMSPLPSRNDFYAVRTCKVMRNR